MLTLSKYHPLLPLIFTSRCLDSTQVPLLILIVLFHISLFPFLHLLNLLSFTRVPKEHPVDFCLTYHFHSGFVYARILIRVRFSIIFPGKFPAYHLNLIFLIFSATIAIPVENNIICLTFLLRTLITKYITYVSL